MYARPTHWKRVLVSLLFLVWRLHSEWHNKDEILLEWREVLIRRHLLCQVSSDRLNQIQWLGFYTVCWISFMPALRLLLLTGVLYCLLDILYACTALATVGLFLGHIQALWVMPKILRVPTVEGPLNQFPQHGQRFYFYFLSITKCWRFFVHNFAKNGINWIVDLYYYITNLFVFTIETTRVISKTGYFGLFLGHIQALWVMPKILRLIPEGAFPLQM